jgi:hypothetical protein
LRVGLFIIARRYTYGTFQLDMTVRLPLDPPMSAASAGQLPLHGV